jgi:hypothetical protein
VKCIKDHFRLRRSSACAIEGFLQENSILFFGFKDLTFGLSCGPRRARFFRRGAPKSVTDEGAVSSKPLLDGQNIKDFRSFTLVAFLIPFLRSKLTSASAKVIKGPPVPPGDRRRTRAPLQPDLLPKTNNKVLSKRPLYISPSQEQAYNSLSQTDQGPFPETGICTKKPIRLRGTSACFNEGPEQVRRSRLFQVLPQGRAHLTTGLSCGAISISPGSRQLQPFVRLGEPFRLAGADYDGRFRKY